MEKYLVRIEFRYSEKSGIMYYEKRGENPIKLKKELKRMEALKLLTNI